MQCGKSGLFENVLRIRILLLVRTIRIGGHRQIRMGALADNIKWRLRVRRDIISTPTRHRIYVNMTIGFDYYQYL